MLHKLFSANNSSSPTQQKQSGNYGGLNGHKRESKFKTNKTQKTNSTIETLDQNIEAEKTVKIYKIVTTRKIS